jgi:hypothetical protein
MELLLRLIPNFSKTQHVQLCHLPRLWSYRKSIEKKNHRNWPIYDLHSRRGQRSGHNKVGRSSSEMPNIYSQVKLLTYPTVCRVLKTPFLTVLGMGDCISLLQRVIISFSNLLSRHNIKLKHEPNIVEITHLCIRHGVHTRLTNKVFVCVFHPRPYN